MFKHLIPIIAVSLIASTMGCDDSDDSTPSKDSECTQNVCKDNATLVECVNGVKKESKCPQGQACVDNACKVQDSPSQDDKCTQNTCKDDATLVECINGVKKESKCPQGQACVDNACKIQDSPSQDDKCTQNTCKDDATLIECVNGVKKESKCPQGQACVDNACKVQDSPSQEECTVGVCDESDPNKVKACIGGKWTEQFCPEGQSCYGGGCMTTVETGAECTQPTGYGKCTADGKNAIVCHKSKITKYTCAEPCIDGADGMVDCPKKASTPTANECDPKTYTPQCINGGANVKVCVKREIVQWDCNNNSCSIDSKGEITCPRPVADGALTSGGTYGDPCDPEKYQEACIDNYYALICDYDNIVRIKPAGDCAISKENPLKVTYSQGAACDTTIDSSDLSNIMPFCINNGKAIGFCAYVSDDLTIGEYKAAQCADCTSQERAVECMLE